MHDGSLIFTFILQCDDDNTDAFTDDDGHISFFCWMIPTKKKINFFHGVYGLLFVCAQLITYCLKIIADSSIRKVNKGSFAPLTPQRKS